MGWTVDTHWSSRFFNDPDVTRAYDWSGARSNAMLSAADAFRTRYNKCPYSQGELVADFCTRLWWAGLAETPQEEDAIG